MISAELTEVIDRLAKSRQQRDNAFALLNAFKAGAVPMLTANEVDRNPYTDAIVIHWKSTGTWDYVFLDVFDDRFETCLSRNLELRIKYWPIDLNFEVFEGLLAEIEEGLNSKD